MTYGFQIQSKVFQVKESQGESVCDSSSFAEMFEDCKSMAQEGFFLVTLDQKNRVIDRHMITLGTLTASLVHPREVFRAAISDAAASIAFVHNHPTGDSTPSKEDHALTKRLCEGAKILGIRVLDHVIVAREGSFSFCDAGLL